MVVQFWLLSLNNAHELVYFESKSVEVGTVHAMEGIVHQVLENVVHYKLVIAKLQNVLAQVIHALQVPYIRVVKCKALQDLHQGFS